MGVLVGIPLVFSAFVRVYVGSFCQAAFPGGFRFIRALVIGKFQCFFALDIVFWGSLGSTTKPLDRFFVND